MARISTAIKQNNVAVSLIEGARFNEAIPMLKALIPQFQDDLKAQAVNRDTHSEPRSVLLHHLLLQSATAMLHRRGTGCDEQDGFLYDQAVEIPQKVALETPDIATRTVSCILIFNLALALQLKAISGTTTSKAIRDRYFSNSMSLYHLVMALNASCRLFSMIILNNVALIHQEYKNHGKAKACFQRLLAIWMMSPVYPKDLEGLVYNAMGLYDTSSLPAAAA